MLPALEKERSRIGNADPRVYWTNLLLRFSLKVGKPISWRLMDAVAGFDRSEWVRPFWEEIDRQFEIDEADAQESAKRLFDGRLTPIWADPVVDHESINTTELGLIAYMLDLALPENKIPDRALIIGSGCGIAPAILERLGSSEVVGIESTQDLVKLSQQVLNNHGFTRTKIKHGRAQDVIDQLGTFDSIVGFAAIGRNETKIVDQFSAHLNIGGRMVFPHGPPGRWSYLTRIERKDDDYYRETKGEVTFIKFET